jgi:exopolysaccharide production protein ExoZ
VHTEFQGVRVFFVISGFIMTYITREDSSQFLVQRLIRIVPLYWLCTLPFVAMWFKGSGRAWADGSIVNIAKSLFFFPYRDANGDVMPLLAVGWTLNLEIFFYALFALSLAITRRWAPVLTCAALIAAKIVHRQLGCSALLCEFYGHEYTTFLIEGVISFYIWKGLEPYAFRWRLIVAPLGGVSVVIFLLWNVHPPFAVATQQWFPFPLYYLMPPLLVTSALLLHSARFRWKWRLALLMGDASYALYLTHTIVIEIFRVSRNKLVGDQIAILHPKESIITAGALLVICSLVAIVVHYRVERPVIQALRRLINGSKRSEPTGGVETDLPRGASPKEA